MLVNLNTGEKQLLAEDVAQNSTVSWTADGKTVYYEAAMAEDGVKETRVEKEKSENGKKLSWVGVYQNTLDNAYEKFNKVCRIDVNTGEKQVICSGQRPVCSNDGRYVAYILYEMKGSRSWKNPLYVTYSGNPRVYVRDILENKEWKLKKTVWEYCFAPEKDYLAVLSDSTGIGTTYSLYVWDFKNNKTHIVDEMSFVGDINWIK